jgi:hypothetical protein
MREVTMKILPILLLLISPMAMAVPSTFLQPYTNVTLNDSGDELFNPTHLYQNSTSQFTLHLESGSWNTTNHEFGIYQYDRSTDSIADTLAILNDAYTSPFGYDVTFDLANSEATSTLGGQMNLDLTAGLEFGFYFISDYVSGSANPDIFYSQAQFNPNGQDLFGLYWETDPNTAPDLWVYASDNDTGNNFDEYIVGVDDVKPIPEPSIAALFGLGLIGLGFVRRGRV